MVSEETRDADERLREELRHVDLEKLKKMIKPLITSKKQEKIPLPANARLSCEKAAYPASS
jgi:hypothetical protein